MSTKGSRTAVTAEVSLGLVGPENGIMPLMASLTSSCADPYAVTMAFHVGTAEPVEWTLARDLLAAALHSREGIGDVQAGHQRRQQPVRKPGTMFSTSR